MWVLYHAIMHLSCHSEHFFKKRKFFLGKKLWCVGILVLGKGHRNMQLRAWEYPRKLEQPCQQKCSFMVFSQKTLGGKSGFIWNTFLVYLNCGASPIERQVLNRCDLNLGRVEGRQQQKEEKHGRGKNCKQ